MEGYGCREGDTGIACDVAFNSGALPGELLVVTAEGAAMLLSFSSFFLLPSPKSLLFPVFGSFSPTGLLSPAVCDLIRDVADPVEVDGAWFSGGIIRHCIATRAVQVVRLNGTSFEESEVELPIVEGAGAALLPIGWLRSPVNTMMLKSETRAVLHNERQHTRSLENGKNEEDTRAEVAFESWEYHYVTPHLRFKGIGHF